MKYVLAIALAAVLFGISMNASATGKPEPANSSASAGAVGVGIGVGVGQGGSGGNGGAGGSVSVRGGSPTLRAEQSLDLSIINEARRRDVASAFAPSINPTTLCVSPIVGGLQLPGFGISGGSVFEGDTCDTIEQAKTTVHTFGDLSTGEELMCGLKKYREARRRNNRPCLEDTPHSGAQMTETCLDPSGNPYADPLVAARACPAK